MLEIGLANGITSIYLLMGAKDIDGHLISIDPFQISYWKSAGLDLVEELKLKTYHIFIKKSSHIILPQLLDKKGAKSSYNMIFINGWNTFDYTVVNIFFADKLLKIGGIIIIDNFLYKGTNTYIIHMISSWSHYKKIDSPTSFAAFEKIGEDKRELEFHKTF